MLGNADKTQGWRRKSARILLLFAICVGLLLPRMSAVLVELMPGLQSMVICTGEGLVVVTLGPDGTPIEQTDTPEHRCVMSENPAVADVTIPFWQRLAGDYHNHFGIVENLTLQPNDLMIIGPTRGPPVPV